MIEKVWAIKGREEKVASNGNQYLQIIIAGDDGKDHKHNLYEKGMWAVFQNNDYVKVELDKPEGKGWEVKSASSVTENLPPSKAPEPLLEEHQAVIEKAVAEATPIPVKEPAPQAVGMCTKELGDMIRAEKLIALFGHDVGVELVRWYRRQVLGITKVPFDGGKLPDFKKKE